MFLTQDQIENFPCAHLSVSSMKQYMSDPQMFFKRYVRLEFEQEQGPAAVEGKACHSILEAFYNSIKDGLLFDYKKELEKQFDLIDEMDVKGYIDWGKTGSIEKSVQTVEQGVNFYMKELPNYPTILGTEMKFLTDFEDLEGNTMPIPLKGFCDLVIEDKDGKLAIIDHKFISFTKDQSERDAGYELQAAAYWFLSRKYFGRNPDYMIFDQVKKSKNRDGSPQLIPYRIDYTPTLLRTFIEVYRRMVLQLSGVPIVNEEGYMKFLPNPFAMFDGQKSWDDFCQEVEEQKVWNLADFKKNKFDLDLIPLIDL